MEKNKEDKQAKSNVSSSDRNEVLRALKATNTEKREPKKLFAWTRKKENQDSTQAETTAKPAKKELSKETPAPKKIENTTKPLPIIPTTTRETSKPAKKREMGAQQESPKTKVVDHFWLKTIPFFIAIVILGGIVFINMGLYFVESISGPAKTMAKFVHYPVVVYGTSVISYTDFDDELSAMRRLGSITSSDPSLVSQSKDETEIVLSKLIRDKALDEGYKKYDIQVTEQDLDSAFLNLFGASRGTVTASAVSQEVFGVDSIDVTTYLLSPYIKKQKLSQALAQDPDESQRILVYAHQTKDIIGDSEDTFSQFFDDESKAPGHFRSDDLGFFNTNNLPDAFKTIATLSVGSISDVLESSVGFHIVHVTDTISQGSVTYLELEQLLFEKPDADSWMYDKLKEKRVVDLVPGYEWQSLCLQVLKTGKNCFTPSSLSQPLPENVSDFDLESFILGTQSADTYYLPAGNSL